jgi:hypothetical protein
VKSRNHRVRGHVARQGRQERAAARQHETDDRTPTDRLAALDARLGVGQGAVRERARLNGETPAKRKNRKRKAKR